MEILYIILGVSILLNIFLFWRGIRLVTQVEQSQFNIVVTNENTLQTLETMLEEMRQLDLKGSF